jgi:hypothetical protein
MRKESYADRDYAVADRDYAVGYVGGGVTYVPHYTRFGVYVGPGYSGLPTQKTYSASELELLGAQKTSLLLWVRPQLPKTH